MALTSPMIRRLTLAEDIIMKKPQKTRGLKHWNFSEKTADKKHLPQDRIDLYSPPGCPYPPLSMMDSAHARSDTSIDRI